GGPRRRPRRWAPSRPWSRAADADAGEASPCQSFLYPLACALSKQLGRLQSTRSHATAPRDMDTFTRWIHLLALATYFGTTLGLALQLLPAAEAVDDPALQRRLLARGLRAYNGL